MIVQRENVNLHPGLILTALPPLVLMVRRDSTVAEAGHQWASGKT